MRLLVLGGTRFAGSYLTEAALARGHQVTLVHRGETAVEAYSDAEHLLFDRREGHAALAGRAWDAVVDLSGYSPGVVRDAVRTLEPAVSLYLFVSSVSAYADLGTEGISEAAPLADLPEEVAADASADLLWDVDMDYYGGLKAACEHVVAEGFGSRRTIIVRPGLIVGPRDPTDRFNYWVSRIAAGGNVLAPAPPEVPIRVIDARDLGSFLLHLVEQRFRGAFNAGGPSLTFGEMFEELRSALDSDATPVWVDPEFLLERDVEPWSELPLWLPSSLGLAGMGSFSSARAAAAGLALRPLGDTARDTLEWLAHQLPNRLPARDSMTPEREHELLTAWALANEAAHP